MKSVLRKHPWLPVAAAYLVFICVWIWFAWFAARHSPPVVPQPPAAHAR